MQDRAITSSSKRANMGGPGSLRLSETSARTPDLQTTYRIAISADDSGARAPASATLRDFQQQFIRSFFESNGSRVLIVLLPAVNIIAVDHLAVEPGFDAIIAAHQENAAGSFGNNDRRAEVSRAILRARKHVSQRDVVCGRHVLPLNRTVIGLRPKWNIENGRSPDRPGLAKRPANLPIANERHTGERFEPHRQRSLVNVTFLVLFEHLHGRLAREFRVRLEHFFGDAHDSQRGLGGNGGIIHRTERNPERIRGGDLSKLA